MDIGEGKREKGGRDGDLKIVEEKRETWNTTERPSSKQVCFRINICSIHDGTPLWMHPSSHGRARTHACLLLSVRHSYVTRRSQRLPPLHLYTRKTVVSRPETWISFASARSSPLGKYLVVCSFCLARDDSSILDFLSAPRLPAIFSRPLVNGELNQDLIRFNSIRFSSLAFFLASHEFFFFLLSRPKLINFSPPPMIIPAWYRAKCQECGRVSWRSCETNKLRFTPWVSTRPCCSTPCSFFPLPFTSALGRKSLKVFVRIKLGSNWQYRFHPMLLLLNADSSPW